MSGTVDYNQLCAVIGAVAAGVNKYNNGGNFVQHCLNKIPCLKGTVNTQNLYNELVAATDEAAMIAVFEMRLGDRLINKPRGEAARDPSAPSTSRTVAEEPMLFREATRGSAPNLSRAAAAPLPRSRPATPERPPSPAQSTRSAFQARHAPADDRFFDTAEDVEFFQNPSYARQTQDGADRVTRTMPTPRMSAPARSYNSGPVVSHTVSQARSVSTVGASERATSVLDRMDPDVVANAEQAFMGSTSHSFAKDAIKYISVALGFNEARATQFYTIVVGKSKDTIDLTDKEAYHAEIVRAGGLMKVKTLAPGIVALQRQMAQLRVAERVNARFGY